MGTRRTSTPKHPTNTRLRWQRLQRGWSHQEVVEQIKRSIEQADEGEAGLNADMVGRWETGGRKPDPRYKKHLVLVFDLPASELGLLSSEELALCPADPVVPAPTTNVIMDEQLIDVVVKKVMLVLLGGNAEFGRPVFLKGLLGASLAALFSNGVAIPDGAEALAAEQRTRLDRQSVDAFAAITASHRDLYWTTAAAELVPSATAHVHLGTGMLKSTSDAEGPQARQLASAVAESSLLASRLLFFDLAQGDAAEPFFQLADDAASTSQDHALAAAVLGHRAFVPGFAGQLQPASDYLSAAHAHARYGAGPLLRSWLHCVDAEVSARAGQPRASLTRIRSAEDALVTAGTNPTWLDFFDSSRLDGFAGNALLLAGRNREASGRLQNALDNLAETATKQKAVLLFDLAAAYASTDAEHAVATVRQACDLVGQTPYSTALQRVPDVRAALSATPYVDELDERVRALSGPVREA
ncbi:helix-turn-helix transcriptional regulator [Amycolatopsis sp. H20-H5]|uniref:helix-turn-helix transcriptional regulator n=1 Tax=Amycolatopsis sp. H20-H5 TaxID=3046309 RepID=UPI002DBD25C5|nr:helix-turn-helix transcriptional regulator [Amycolatopsis sp. H20-H5]MEC3978907.1 helix-turn-helix transcriptional regulator [Amycolatopsis sp. H20-H5]